MKPVSVFNRMGYQEKKKVLLGIMQQLEQVYPWFKDTIFLLQASNKIWETTLTSIYQEVYALLKNMKNISSNEYKKRVEKIQEKIREEEIERKQEQEDAEAELLLSNLA